jgi:hypothetical protein
LVLHRQCCAVVMADTPPQHDSDAAAPAANSAGSGSGSSSTRPSYEDRLALALNRSFAPRQRIRAAASIGGTIVQDALVGDHRPNTVIYHPKAGGGVQTQLALIKAPVTLPHHHHHHHLPPVPLTMGKTATMALGMFVASMAPGIEKARGVNGMLRADRGLPITLGSCRLQLEATVATPIAAAAAVAAAVAATNVAAIAAAAPTPIAAAAPAAAASTMPKSSSSSGSSSSNSGTSDSYTHMRSVQTLGKPRNAPYPPNQKRGR